MFIGRARDTRGTRNIGLLIIRSNCAPMNTLENIVRVTRRTEYLFADLCYQLRISVAHEWRRVTSPVRKFGLELAHD